MAITEETRHHLYQALERQLGPEEAATLMEHLPPVGWADVATKSDLAHLETVMGMRMDMLEQRFAEVDRRFDQVDRRFEEIDRRFDLIDARLGGMDGRIDGLQAELVAVRLSIEAMQANQAAFLRQLSLALFVALVSILAAVIGLR
ncbi:MAG: hypothetical protein H6519_11470 [Microthrixaceae bacterium]|nr:hypothetical protein [Acidimicrobiales bacterium]MCB9405041.1 hypothetical protein [Microthrixaceae bacterium]